MAPEGIVTLIDVPLQEFTVTGVPFKKTELPFCVLPKPVPEMTAVLPGVAGDGETPVIAGAGLPVELSETLSNFAVAAFDVVPLVTASPM